MNVNLKGISEHMLQLGLGALAHANRHSGYSNMLNDSWSDLAVLQAAHSAEILIKARIAEEHPLLIFEQLPKAKQLTSDRVSIEDLFKNGKTIQWSDLPERLYLSTGIELPNVDVFKEFGKLRNGIQHFASVSDKPTSWETYNFVFKVIDPFIYDCWGLYAVDYDEDFDSQEHFPASLLRNEILFNVSPSIVSSSDYWDVDWQTLNEGYVEEMKQRIEDAKQLILE
ncbi:hypothetical protein F8154_11035 [Alkaliphilus pronyensis]|uniref:Uncharacterized protein n=1 Tax=Alkaliphilus pronyensis TaxID=1482732 RepID=A0A6I0EY64_9FIRM|nr:hypothetical protein [Alkaliphilus pronyensis]KAB3532927.1 hypothetical protein F8154_11035 [Alkaliphilus pronyensis]